MGTAHRQESPRRSDSGGQRLNEKIAREVGPQVPDEYLSGWWMRSTRLHAKPESHRADRADWVLQRPTVSTGSSVRATKNLRQNLGAVGWNLTPDQIALLMLPAPTPVYPHCIRKVSSAQPISRLRLSQRIEE